MTSNQRNHAPTEYFHTIPLYKESGTEHILNPVDLSHRYIDWLPYFVGECPHFLRPVVARNNQATAALRHAHNEI